MSIIPDVIKNLGKHLLPKTARDTTEDEQTLNQQIESGAINNKRPDISNLTRRTLNQQISDGTINKTDPLLSNVPDNSPDTNTTGFLDPTTNLTDMDSASLVEKARATQDKEESGWMSRLWNWVQGTPEAVSTYFKSQWADSEAQAKEKQVAIGYDEDSGDVLYLDLNEDRGLFDWTWGKTREGTKDTYERYKQLYLSQISNPYATKETNVEALNQFYNNTKGLFRIRADDYYSDGFFFNKDGTRIGRRKDNYTQDELDALAKNNVAKGKYDNVSFDEWLEYVQADFDNADTKTNIYSGYGLTADEDTDIISLSNSAQQDRFGGYQTTAMAGIENTLQQYIGDKNPRARNDALLAIQSVVTDQATREWAIVQPVYAAEQVVLAKPESERSEGEKELLEKAELLRRMEKAAARGINNWATQEIKYGTNSRGEIVESLDVFEGGQSLSDVLSGEAKRISGREWNDRDSTIDVMGQIANEALYSYHQGKGSGLTPAWRWAQKTLAPTGRWLGEFGQQVGMKILQTSNIALSAIQPWRRDDFAEKLTGEQAVSATASYLDQDFTVGRLIETDDGNIKRTVKKYLLEGAEYIPEISGNFIPDLLITAFTGGGGVVSFARHIPKVYEALKAVRGTSLLNKVRVATSTLKGGASGLTGLKNSIAGLKNINTTWKAAGDLVDRAITQGLIDQAMDAQWSGFDTEAYSGTSEVLSVLGTVGMTMLPDMLTLSKGITRKLNPDRISGSLWDVAEYMDSSPQAAENIARSLGKNIGDISIDDLKQFAKNFKDISDAAKAAYAVLPIEGKDAANKWSKKLMNSYINQIYGSNSEIAKTARLILNNGGTNPADLIKYLGKIPGEVSFGPFVSTIKLKSGTQANAVLKGGAYNEVLDSLEGGFARRLNEGFTQADIEDITKLRGFSDISAQQDKLFYELNGKKYLTEEGLDKFGLKAENMPLETLGISLSQAENVRELFKERMKGIKDKKISDSTVDAIADSGAYEEVVSKVKELVC